MDDTTSCVYTCHLHRSTAHMHERTLTLASQTRRQAQSGLLLTTAHWDWKNGFMSFPALCLSSTPTWMAGSQ